MWKQTKSFNKALGGSRAGWCLRNTRLGFGIAPWYANATQAWNNTEKHQTRDIPLGIDVPLFYSYTVLGVNLGHINVRLANGTVWSDGTIYNSLWAYESTHRPKYLGWGESINGVRVISYVGLLISAPKMPAIGSKIKLANGTRRTTFRAGTQTQAGVLKVTDETFIYTIRAYDPRYPNRILINSRSAGGDGVALALFYTNGNKIDGWQVK